MTEAPASSPRSNPAEPGPDVIVGPIRRTPDGIGVYDPQVPVLVKELRAAGVIVTYEDPPETRRFLDQKSAVGLIAMTLALNLLSAAGYDTLKWAIGRMKRSTWLHLRLRRGPRAEEQTYDAAAGDVAALLAQADGDAVPVVEASDPVLIAGAQDLAERRFSKTKEVEERLAAAEAYIAKAESLVDSSTTEAEREARVALERFASALNWAEGGPFEGAVHARMDQAGRWVRRRFGCTLHREGKQYSQRCPVALGHNRVGMSLGGYSRKLCSICGEDYSECPHQPGEDYVVKGGLGPLEWCRVCCEREGCEHLADERYRARMVVIVVEGHIEEVSIVDTPAFPDARITAVSIALDDLREELGEAFQPGVEVSCNRCLLDCDGLRRPESSTDGL